MWFKTINEAGNHFVYNSNKLVVIRAEGKHAIRFRDIMHSNSYVDVTYKDTASRDAELKRIFDLLLPMKTDNNIARR